MLRYVASAGVEAGHWWGELTVDQRAADAFSLVFDSQPLVEDVEILGFPLVELHGSADAEPLHWFGRLCDVAPDGTVTLVTGGGRAGRPDPLRDGGSLVAAARAVRVGAGEVQAGNHVQALGDRLTGRLRVEERLGDGRALLGNVLVNEASRRRAGRGDGHHFDFLVGGRCGEGRRSGQRGNARTQ